ncbi:MAG: hypothetical protein ACRDLL_10755 [Solirubrobacterales bacterium]
MIRDYAGAIVAAVGVVAVAFALLSEPLGITHGTFGAKHVVLLAFGVVLIVGGAVAQRRAL